MEKQVLITGSSRGIGKETALYLANNSYNIVLHCNKNTAKAQEIAREIESLGVSARVLQFNIKDREECKSVIEKDIEENGIYYGVVLNAGIARDNVFPAMEDDEWDEVLNTNLGGFYNVLKPVILL